jgi:hypothetical protein
MIVDRLRSRRKRKAWGVSPRNREMKCSEPVKRATALNVLSPAIAGSSFGFLYPLELAPQALCFRLLSQAPNITKTQPLDAVRKVLRAV